MRRRIWEQTHYQCSIIGTCLNIRELHKIVRQSKIDVPANISEFELHGTIVSCSGSKSVAAKMVEKILNKKYSAHLKRFSRLQTETEVIDAWKEALSQGDIPGPYWALLSHPLVSEKTRSEAFGEVHMLSHLVGSANRADIKALAGLQRQLETENERFANMKKSYRLRLKELGQASTEKRKKIKMMALQLEQLQNISRASTTLDLQKENASLQKNLDLQSATLLKTENENNKLKTRLEEQKKIITYLKAELRDKEIELQFMEEELQNVTQPLEACPAECEMAGTDQCPGPLLCGKKILYVGGRTNLVHHYRSLVERHGAKFIHHDGGIEDTKNSLPKILNTVDSVICPIDCVSHNACLLVKDACKQRVKPLKFIRSSGLSSLARSLVELGEAANEGALYS